MRKKNIWLLSAYKAESHANWAHWLTKNIQDVEWNLLELPGRYFNWRIRGNPLSWYNKLPKELPDLIIATSMVDLATLKGINPQLANIKCYYYFHENQFAYPISPKQVESIEPQVVQLYGALAADKIIFNSNYNKTTFLEGVINLLDKMPDEVPVGILEVLKPKISILPVPIEPVKQLNKIDNLILWNHRWEYDKAPDLFVKAILELKNRNIDFKLALLGSRPEKPPTALQKIRNKAKDHILYDGKVDQKTYKEILGKSKIVISTSKHEFQGLAMLEATSAGAIPLAPNELCYPEQYPESNLYKSGDLLKLIEKLKEMLKPESISNCKIDQYYSENLHQKWENLIKK